ncbi:MAG: YbbR-like domain-containing protein [Candidatus Omnitrophica bacterium]|nr:YbbR-like domain-containing protein [Candidatus Omnitrophota bacterium]
MKTRKIIFHNVGLKSLSLLLAFITWVYIGEVAKGGEGKTVLQKFLSPISYTAAQLFIKPIFVSEPPEGYKLLEENVKIDPEYLMVAGPANVLAKKEFAYTKPIDLSEHTKSKILDVELENLSRSISFKKVKVQVYLPIEKTAVRSGSPKGTE